MFTSPLAPHIRTLAIAPEGAWWGLKEDRRRSDTYVYG